MVLHSMGEFKNQYGKSYAKWQESQDISVKLAVTDAEKDEIRAQKFSDGGLNKVKVVELTEA